MIKSFLYRIGSRISTYRYQVRDIIAGNSFWHMMSAYHKRLKRILFKTKTDSVFMPTCQE
jgi:hypothetical protein